MVTAVLSNIIDSHLSWQIVFPYDRIYPGASNHRCKQFHHTHRTTEQYAYMCDLKRTLDATVCTYGYFQAICSCHTAGTLRTGNAFRDREDSLPALLNRLVSAGIYSVSA